MAVFPVHPYPVHCLPKRKELPAAVVQIDVFQHFGRMRAKTIHAFDSDRLGGAL